MNTKVKIIIAFILGILISGVSVYAATSYLASEIEYKDTTVEGALNDLYTVHETYKNLNTETNFTASDLKLGKTAYNNLGELITGANKDNCISGSFNCVGNCNNETGMRIEEVDFVPTLFFVMRKNNIAALWYNSNYSTDYFYASFNSNYSPLLFSQFFEFDNGIILKNWSNEFVGESYYIACK